MKIVSMPYVGLTSLHLTNSHGPRFEWIVSMPYVGLTSLHKKWKHVQNVGIKTVCQCPMSGSRLCTLTVPDCHVTI